MYHVENPSKSKQGESKSKGCKASNLQMICNDVETNKAIKQILSQAHTSKKHVMSKVHPNPWIKIVEGAFQFPSA